MQKVASADDFPGFICPAVSWISSGVKGACLIWLNFAAISGLIPDAASPSNNFAKWDLNLQQKDLGCGHWCFQKFPKGFGVCKPSFLQVPDLGCMGLSTFLVKRPSGMFHL